jgi:hypothetical protein
MGRVEGESAKGVSRPNGIDRGPQSGQVGRHQVKGRKRSPAQSNRRAEHKAHSTTCVAGIFPTRRR